MSRIFISHSSRDTEQAARLLAWLHANGFTETFLDFDKHAGLAPGADWERTLYREMAGAEAVILILTKNWFDSKWCFAEFTQARALGKAIFPLIEAPTGETFVSRDIQHLDLVKDREGGLERLATELTEVVLNARGGFPWDVTRPPFPGLLAFDEADAAIYFGRDDDIRRLIERLNARRAQGGTRLLAVLGASGSGKSSLLRAGVLPRLKRDKRNWIVLPPFRPQLHPLEELAQAVAIALGPGADWRHWRDAFAAEDLERVLSDLARDLRAAHTANEAQILVTIDQAEELFGAVEKTEIGKFLRIVNGLMDERLPFLVVMALRSDYLGHLQEAQGLNAPFEEFSLKPMPLERVRDIIEGPARVAGLSVDGALVSAAMKDAATDDALPLLAFALRELYDRFGKNKHLTLASYAALGDSSAQLSPLENAVRRKADDVLYAAKPSPEVLQTLKEAFVPAMVRVNPEGEYARRTASIDSLPVRARPIVERLAQARLLIIRKENETTVVEVAHEALLRKWPLLRGWLDEEREFLIGKDQLEQDLREWENASETEKTDALLSGLKLTRARTWLIAKPQQLNEPERKFIQASIGHHEAAAAQREATRRHVQRGTIAAALILLIVAAGAVWEWHKAKIQQAMAESRVLAAESQRALSPVGGDLGLALLKGVEATERWPTAEAELALRTALSGPQEILILHHGDNVTSATFSPDGNRILTASGDGTARIWNIGSGRLETTLAGHTAIVWNAEFSPDGKRVATASGDETARIWDVETGHLLATLAGHSDSVGRATFSSDGSRIVTTSRDNTAKVWDAQTGKLLETLRGHSDSLGMAVFFPDGKRILTTSGDNTVRVWDTESGHQLLNIPGDGLELSPDGSRIVTTNPDHTARVWDSRTGHPLATLLGHTDTVYDAAFSRDGKRIVTSSQDRTARVWEAESGKMVATLTGHSSFVYRANFSPDGMRIVTASDDHTARVWDSQTGQQLANLIGHTNWVVNANFSPDGRQIVTAGSDGTARLWNLEFGNALVLVTGRSAEGTVATFSANGTRIVTGSPDSTARVWDAQTGKLTADLAGNSGVITRVAFSPNGKLVVTAGYSKTAQVWNAETGELLATLAGHTSLIYDAEFSPDGKRIVTGSLDKTARVWDAETGRLLTTLIGHEARIHQTSFSPSGKRIVTVSGDETARVWDSESGQLLATLTGHAYDVLHASFSLDGRRIVTAGQDSTARIWESESGRPLMTLVGHSTTVNSASFSPNGKRIVTSSGDGTARVWDAETGKSLTVLTGHSSSVYDAVFSPDGKRIVTSGDHTARLWEADTGKPLGALTGHTDMIFGARFSPDGKRIVTSSGDGTSRFYVVDLGETLAWAKKKLPIEYGK